MRPKPAEMPESLDQQWFGEDILKIEIYVHRLTLYCRNVLIRLEISYGTQRLQEEIYANTAIQLRQYVSFEFEPGMNIVSFKITRPDIT